MPFEALRFAHASNLLLDHPLRLVGSISTTARSVVVDASLTAFERLIEGCVDQEVDFLLLTGNTFCEEDRSLRARVSLRSGFECLQDAGIQVFVIPGLLDPASSWQEVPDLPECVTIFNPDLDEPTAVLRDANVIATIQGGNVEAQITGQLSADENQAAQRTRPLTIGILPPGKGSSFDADSVEDLLAALSVDYLALATPFPRLTKSRLQSVAHCPGRAVSYARTDTGLQGVTFVSVGAQGQFKCQHLTTSPLRREAIRLKLSDATTWDELIRAMRHVVTELNASPAAKVLLVRWELHGQGDIFDSLQNDEDARTELFQLFAEDVSLGALIVEHRLETVVAAGSDSDADVNRVANPISAGLLRRIESAHSITQAVVADKARHSESPQFIKRLKFIASRADDAQVRDHAKRAVARWFENVGK